MSVSRMDVERRREEAQRMRANQAQLASKSQTEDIPDGPLFDAPRKIDRSDGSSIKIKSILGEWNEFTWKSGMPVKAPSSTLSKPDTGSPAQGSQRTDHSTPTHPPRLNGQHKQVPVRTEPSSQEHRRDASREHSSSISATNNSSSNTTRHQVDSRSRPQTDDRSYKGDVRPGFHSSPPSRPPTGSSSVSVSHVARHDRTHPAVARGSVLPRSVSPKSKHLGSVAPGPGKPRSVSPSSHDGSIESSVPGSHPAKHSSSSESQHQRHNAHPNLARSGLPELPTPPPPVHRTPPPPPVVHSDTPPAQAVGSRDNSSRSPGCQGQAKPKHLTLQIKQDQPVDFKDLDNIFEEMTVRPPHTAIQTPVKSNMNRFPFPSARHEEVEVNKDKAALSSQKETSSAKSKEETIPVAEENSSVLEEDLVLSDSEDNDEAEEGPPPQPAAVPPPQPAAVPPPQPAAVPPPQPAAVPPPQPAAVPPPQPAAVPPLQPAAVPPPQPAAVPPAKKRTGPSMSSSNESSSDSGSSTDDSSDSDSSTSGDEKDEDVEEKEEESDVLEKKEEPEEKWNLKNFMVARPSPPVPAFSGNLPSMDSGHMKPGADVDVADMKVSPRKMADIGPCTSMPFMPHEDLDSILRGSEKASPDAPSTASSTASTQLVGKMVQSKGQGHPDKQQVADKPTATTTPQENITSGPGRPVSVSGNRSATGTTPAKRKGSVRDESASTATPERKRKQRDVKMKGSRPALVRTSSSSDVDIESVTPDPRSSQAAAVITSADKVLESVSKQLFISPLSSPLSNTDHEQQISHSHTENDRLTDLKPASELPARNKPHHRKDKDHASSSERGRKQDSSWSAGAGIRVKLSSRKANSEGSSHIDNIMAEMKEEFKLPAMLSPTEPHKSPSALAKDGKMAETTVGYSSNHVPTSACGKPSIVVRIIPSKLRNGLRQSRRISRTTALKRESAASVPSVFSDNTSVSVEKGAVAAGSLSPVPGACNKPVVDQTASVSPARSSTSSPARLASSKHKKEWKDPEPSETVSVKKPKSGGQQPVKSASKTSAESSQNGVEHPEVVKKATKRTLERRSSNRSLSSSVKKPKPESQSVKHAAEAEVPEQNGLDTVLPFNTYTATRSPARPSPSPATNNTSAHPASDPLLPTEERLEQPDFYLLRAKELKHIADKAEKPAKLVPYIKSILYFIMWGYSMEKQNHNEPNRVFPLYSDTCQLLQYVSRIRGNLNAAGSSQDSELAGRDKKLSVLILRMQSLLNLKMFSLKKPEAMKFKKIIEHEYKSSSLKISAHAPSPHQNSWNKSSTGIPSPMSPTPSPTCSIGSVGSQGSCEQSSSKPANGSVSGNASAMSSPGTVTVPQRIHTVTQKYMAVTAHLVQSHDLWDQADCEAVTSKGFFSNLDNRCGPLSLHSSMLHLVVYVNSALKEMGCS